MRLTQFSLSLLASTALIVGCMTPSAPESAGTAPLLAPIGFFEVEQGTARLSVRVVDSRLTTQAFANADSFNYVLFQLTNPGKLKAPLKKLVAATSNSTFQAVFSGLPSDAATGYTLTATLLRNIPVHATLNDPSLSNADSKVGEGVSSAFALVAGENRTVPIVINALGAVSLGTSFTLNQFVNFGVSVAAASNPRATQLRYGVYMGLAPFGPETRVGLPSQSPATLTFMAPPIIGSFKMVVDLLEGERVLSRRIKTFNTTVPYVPPCDPSHPDYPDCF